MRVMTQLSGVSSPFSLLGCSFMYPPVISHFPDNGSFALPWPDPNHAVFLAAILPELTLQIESQILTQWIDHRAKSRWWLKSKALRHSFIAGPRSTSAI